MFTIVGDLLRESPAPPALRRALWEVAATIPGVQLVGPVTDAAGRAGVAVERGRARYVLDPSDGRLLEESEGSPSDANIVQRDSAGNVIGVQRRYFRTTYLEQGPANSAPAATPRPASKG